MMDEVKIYARHTFRSNSPYDRIDEDGLRHFLSLCIELEEYEEAADIQREIDFRKSKLPDLYVGALTLPATLLCLN